MDLGNIAVAGRRLTAAVMRTGDQLLALLVPRRLAQAADCWYEYWNDADGQGNVCWQRWCCRPASGGPTRCDPWRALCTNCSCPPR